MIQGLINGFFWLCVAINGLGTCMIWRGFMLQVGMPSGKAPTVLGVFIGAVAIMIVSVSIWLAAPGHWRFVGFAIMTGPVILAAIGFGIVALVFMLGNPRH